MDVTFTTGHAIALAVATLGGAAIGVERQRSGHATGPRARFAGVRTFSLLGGLAGLSGWLWTSGAAAPAVVLLAGATGLVVAAYVRASRRDVDGTTEAAALVVLAAGLAAGLGAIALASGAIAVTGLLLVEKTRLHRLVDRLDDAGLKAGLRFAVMAVVILPLLPPGPYGPYDSVRPRALWVLVLFFSGLSFAAYVARRFVGPRQGYAVAGLLGGLISSTSVTLTFSRASREQSGSGSSLAAGVLAACAILFARVLVAMLVLAPDVVPALAAYSAAPFAVGLGSVLVGLRQDGRDVVEEEDDLPGNPLAFGAAVQMAVLFQGVLFLTALAKATYGETGLVLSAAVLGLTDVDALTISMARQSEAGVPASVAAQAVAVGALSNTLVKLALAAAIGRGRFRIVASAGLLAMSAALGAMLLVL